MKENEREWKNTSNLRLGLSGMRSRRLRLGSRDFGRVVFTVLLILVADGLLLMGSFCFDPKKKFLFFLLKDVQKDLHLLLTITTGNFSSSCSSDSLSSSSSSQELASSSTIFPDFFLLVDAACCNLEIPR